MKRPISAMVLCGVLFLSTAVSGDEFSPDSIKTLMKKAANYSFQQFGAGTAAGLDNDWSRGTILTGIMGLYRVTQEKQWLDSVDKWGTKHNWTWASSNSANNYCCLQTYCERYIVDPKPENVYMYQPSKTIIDNVMKGSMADLFGWQDVLYMGPPVFSMVGSITAGMVYYDSLTSTWHGAKTRLFDTTYKLWYWDPKVVSTKTKMGYPQFWGPGNAWVIGGMVRSLKYMPVNYKFRADWVAEFKQLCDTLRSKQQPDGMWRTSLYEPTEFPDPEASCTSFFTYAFALGVKWGLLDKTTYSPVIRKAWVALVKCLKINGMLGRCQSWSLAPGGAGVDNNIPEGQGAFMLAGEGVITILDSLGGTEAVAKVSSSKRESHKDAAKFVNFTENSILIPAETQSVCVYDFQGKIIFKQNFKKTSTDGWISFANLQHKHRIAVVKFE